ncbi:MAG: hypothetical protein EOM73_07335, partial [Bacteroidia bacterium]|nr:hypothetical protein [Bacteroidia bacterium]
MKQMIVLLVIFTGILFVCPGYAQTPDTVQIQTGQVVQQTTPDTSTLLLSKDRQSPFSMVTVFRGLLGMAVLIFIGFLLSTDRKNIPWRTVIV